MYDLANSTSLEHLEKWIQIIRKNVSDIPVVLVGNKADLEQSRQVSKEEGITLLKKYQLATYEEVSAKSGQNVENIFQLLVNLMLKEN